MPSKQESLPRTIKNSSNKVQDTYAKALDNAFDQYGEEEIAHRTAWKAVKSIAHKDESSDSWKLD